MGREELLPLPNLSVFSLLVEATLLRWLAGNEGSEPQLGWGAFQNTPLWPPFDEELWRDSCQSPPAKEAFVALTGLVTGSGTWSTNLTSRLAHRQGKALAKEAANSRTFSFKNSSSAIIWTHAEKGTSRQPLETSESHANKTHRNWEGQDCHLRSAECSTGTCCLSFETLNPHLRSAGGCGTNGFSHLDPYKTMWRIWGHHGYVWELTKANNSCLTQNSFTCTSQMSRKLRHGTVKVTCSWL